MRLMQYTKHICYPSLSGVFIEKKKLHSHASSKSARKFILCELDKKKLKTNVL